MRLSCNIRRVVSLFKYQFRWASREVFGGGVVMVQRERTEYTQGKQHSTSTISGAALANAWKERTNVNPQPDDRLTSRRALGNNNSNTQRVTNKPNTLSLSDLDEARSSDDCACLCASWKPQMNSRRIPAHRNVRMGKSSSVQSSTAFLTIVSHGSQL